MSSMKTIMMLGLVAENPKLAKRRNTKVRRVFMDDGWGDFIRRFRRLVEGGF